MNTTVIKKRKVIDLDEQTFRILSIKAASTGTNLKVLIERMLSDMAENIEDADMYKFLVQTEPDGKKILNKDEQNAFENWLGI
jgi:macrodomain Ter protein organizer (MatP/YcbG family)